MWEIKYKKCRNQMDENIKGKMTNEAPVRNHRHFDQGLR